ncbi:MAG: hypothetical protein DRJ42_31030 [Deltaproteobacteria bacterium]|nr:MAG: hypothetical protein DRJ42_31030 [Deltaproteobacteria bacterium]
MSAIFQAICKQPRMYVQDASYAAVSAFIYGYDLALDGGPLVGFWEWLIVREMEETNLPWWLLLRRQVHEDTDLSTVPTVEQDRELVAALGAALKSYGDARGAHGLDRIYYEYHCWRHALQESSA